MKSSLSQEVGLAILSFISTNLDDLLLLTVFFSNRKLRLRQVVIAQMAGMAILILAGLGVAYVSKQMIPTQWLRALGMIPLGLGLKNFFDIARSSTSRGVDVYDSRLKFGAQTLTLCAIIVANGGDNIAASVPLFATASPKGLVLLIFIYLNLTALWCVLAFWITRLPLVVAHLPWVSRSSGLSRWGRFALPLILVALGMDILLGWRQ